MRTDGPSSTLKHAFKIGFWTGEKGEKAVVGATGRKRQERSIL
jgi:hypothetical protein